MTSTPVSYFSKDERSIEAEEFLKDDSMVTAGDDFNLGHCNLLPRITSNKDVIGSVSAIALQEPFQLV